MALRFLAALLLGLFTAPVLAQPPVEHFARLPAAQGLSISPDGTRIAFVAHEADRKLLVVENLDTGEQVGAEASDLRVFDTLWASNDTVLVRAGEARNVYRVRGDVDISAYIAFNADTLESRPLVPNRLSDGMNFDTARLAGRDPDTGELLIALRDDAYRLHLYPINADTGDRSRARARGHRTTRYWVTAPAADQFVDVRYTADDNLFTVRLEDADGERTLLELERELIPLSVVGFTEDGDLVISSFSSNKYGTSHLRRFNIETGEFTGVLFNDERYDFAAVRLDRHLGHVAGVMIERERGETVWFDEELARRQASLEAAFGGATVSLIDWSENRERFLVRTTTDAQPPIYYLMDFATSNATPIRLAYPELFEAPLASRTPISYRARDGVDIPAYLALPEGEGPHPFVVMVHGGPAARDYGGFHYRANFLASRGYGVIQPQFRGSEGYGKDWEIAGWGEWGTGLMQNDVSDAVAYLREQGLASKICIVGGSYGGYAALAGAAFTPELYDCAVSINGVSDLPQFLDYVDDRYGDDSQPARYWSQSITGETTQSVSRDQMVALSPSRSAQDVTIPVLLMHGDEDSVVPIRQSEIMERNLSRADADVRFVRLNGGDHWLLEYETRVAVMRELEAFLAEHLAD